LGRKRKLHVLHEMRVAQLLGRGIYGNTQRREPGGAPSLLIRERPA